MNFEQSLNRIVRTTNSFMSTSESTESVDAIEEHIEEGRKQLNEAYDLCLKEFEKANEEGKKKLLPLLQELRDLLKECNNCN